MPDPVPPPTTIPESEMSQLARDLVGPLVLGALLNVWLYGAFLMQVQTYFRHAATDPRWMKWMVSGLTIIDTLNSIVSCYVAYDYSVRDFGRVDKILHVTNLFGVMVITIAVTGSIVQIFFGLRVKWLTGNRWLGWGIIIAAFFQSLLGIGSTIGGYIVKEFVKFQKFKSVVTAWLVLAPVTDLVIAVSLVYFLRRSRTGFQDTDDVLTRLTRLTIQTGLITAAWALVDCVLFLSLDNNWHFLFNMALAKLYGNCLVSSLNARTEWSEHHSSSQGAMQNWGEVSKPQQTSVKVTTSRGFHIDDYEMESRPSYQANRGTVVDIRGDKFARDTKVVIGDGASTRGSLRDAEEGSISSGQMAPSLNDHKGRWEGVL